MFLVTNRNILKKDFDDFSERAKDVLGKIPNKAGPNELRLFEARYTGDSWWLAEVPDAPSKKECNEITWKTDAGPCFGSHIVANRVVEEARATKKNILFFVHGYNNDVVDVLDRARRLEELYGVIVIPFTWPANGGGVGGTVSYKSDKRDAKASTGALDRVLAKAAQYLDAINAEAIDSARKAANDAHPDNPERRDELFTHLVNRNCPFRISLMLHSMGNYLYKQMLKSMASEGNRLLFDNVILAAADTNNMDHTFWVDAIRFRRRIYITINENDGALDASRAKGGEEQLARLGHSTFELNSRKALYINLTDASWVRNSHAYFEGKPVEKNASVQEFFHRALNGETAETGLRFFPDRNYFEVR